MKRQNLHIHSNYSWDSDMPLIDIVKKLIAYDIYYAGITDHVEFAFESIDEIKEKLKRREEEIDDLNEKYKGKIKLLKAVEVSEPHKYQKEMETLYRFKLDYIMGSIHNIPTGRTIEEQKQCFKKYYEETLKMIEADQIDVVGHLDYIRRYHSVDSSDLEQIKEISNALLEYDMILEINTSASRRLHGGCFPTDDKIAVYSQIGTDVIIGSDAHRVDELISNIHGGEELAKTYNLKPVIFKNRIRKKI